MTPQELLEALPTINGGCPYCHERLKLVTELNDRDGLICTQCHKGWMSREYFNWFSENERRTK